MNMVSRITWKIGEPLKDGTIFAGISPSNKRPMFTTPLDAGLMKDWDKAVTHASNSNAHRHKDWRVPTIAELHMLFNHRVAIGNFDLSGTFPGGWYVSSTKSGVNIIHAIRFSDGYGSDYALASNSITLRCVRG